MGGIEEHWLSKPAHHCRQASLTLDDEASAAENSDEREVLEDQNLSVSTRPKPLPSRLTEEDIAAHRNFINSLGDDMLWNKVGT